jgi:NitT/TauT family transport system ATP-binding protein
VLPLLDREESMHRSPTSRSRTTGIGVVLSGVRREFPGHVVAVDGVSLSIAPGAFVSVLGPSGCGKSTLLRLVAGLDRPDAGSVAVDRAGQVAFVFQDALLLPWRTVLDNVALPLELARTPPEERRDAAYAALKQVGLDDASLRYPTELSGGMRMRASIARALVTRPRLLLLDEPFAALDELTRARLDDELRGLWHQNGMTVLFVTHSIFEAAYLAERAIVLSRRPARVLADRTLPFPARRTPNLRVQTEFAREVRALQEALEQSGP